MRPDRKTLRIPLVMSLLLAGCAANRAASIGTAEMPYPPSAPPKVEEILHLPTGLRLSIDGMVEMLSGARLGALGKRTTT